MIKIAICDDKEKELSKTGAMCNNYAIQNPEYDIRINSFMSSSELMHCFTQKEQFDIVLLDIYMPEITGMQLARFLRERGSDCQIVFLTTSPSHAVEAFSLHAAHYLVKPFTSEQLADALSKSIIAIEKNRKSQIVLKTSDGLQKVYFAEILYSETEKHVQKISLIDHRCLQTRITCSELFELLSGDSRFYKCGSTYIMNLEKIKEVTTAYIFFENGIRIPMQRRQYRELLDRYTGYILEGN